jgi:hypothetical protein
MQQCNTQDCVGDEICIARQDLVIALDGSGSLKQEGFDMVQKFALNLTSKYQSVYYGVEDMKIGLVLFGNGEYFDNGTVAPAIEVVSITSDLDSVSTAIAGLQWQRGFTNMMQALQAADNMFAEGRDDAQSAVMVISDGKWTNAYRTTMKATAMKDKGVQIFMAPIAEYMDKKLVVLRGWASDPWETNFERIPGLDALINNEPEYAQKLLVKFCPKAFSPSQRLEEEQPGLPLDPRGGLPLRQLRRVEVHGQHRHRRGLHGGGEGRGGPGLRVRGGGPRGKHLLLGGDRRYRRAVERRAERPRQPDVPGGRLGLQPIRLHLHHEPEHVRRHVQ